MKKIALLICLLLVGFVPLALGNAAYEAEAIKAADAWLVLIDAKQYKESWAETATFFREQISEDQWIQSMRSADKLMDKVKSRSIISKAYMKQLPKAPKGDYVVILYEAHMQNGRKAIETVTPMKDVDNQWRVSGYYIRPN